MKKLDIRPFVGQHCETTATGTLLKQLNIEFSEPMLFGLGEGLGFIFWRMKSMKSPFLGGRIKSDLITENLARNLNLRLIKKETTSKHKAWESVKELIDNGKAVGLKLDCFHLQYFSRRFHFAGHYVAIYGYDNENAFLVDTQQQGSQVKTSLSSLALARAEKGPMSSSNLYYTLEKEDKTFDLKSALKKAIKSNAADYLNPPITNIGYKGVAKTSNEIIKWFETSKDIKNEFAATAMIMEKAGTGGALFRNLYRDFLEESYECLKHDKLKRAHEAFVEIAVLWSTVSSLFGKVSQTASTQYISEASEVLMDISRKEKTAMEVLVTL